MPTDGLLKDRDKTTASSHRLARHLTINSSTAKALALVTIEGTIPMRKIQGNHLTFIKSVTPLSLNSALLTGRIIISGGVLRPRS